MAPYNMRFKLPAVPGWSLTTRGSNFPLSLNGPLQHEAQTFRFPWMVPNNMRLKLSPVPGWYLQPETQIIRCPWMFPYNMRLKLSAVPGWSLTT